MFYNLLDYYNQLRQEVYWEQAQIGNYILEASRK